MKANKQLGQHFLINNEIIQRISSLPNEVFPATTTTIVEVGPGMGAITSSLVAWVHGQHLPNCQFRAIETDPRMVSYLQKKFSTEMILHADALTFDFASFKTPIYLISNLPYYLAAPLTLKFCRLDFIMAMRLMYQKEMAERLLAANGQFPMNTFALMTATQFQISKLVDVGQEAFSPPPKVQSMVLDFVRLQQPIIPLYDLDAFEQTIRPWFEFPRKQLKNNLSPQVQELAAQLSFDLTRRPGTLTLQEAKALFYAIKSTKDQ